MQESGSFQTQEMLRLPWYALLVRSRRENQVLTQLLGQGYECFLPVYKSERRWSDRMKEIQQPLFPGYLFCRFDIHNRGPVLMAPGVHQIVGIGRTPVPVSETEIESIRRVLASGLPSQPWLYLQVGQRVRWYLMATTGFEFHAPHWHGNTVTINRMRADVAGLLPMGMVVADMVPDNPGTWLFHCHVGPHLLMAMQSLYHVLPR